jgi:hypothetical protein
MTDDLVPCAFCAKHLERREIEASKGEGQPAESVVYLL